MTTLCTHTTVSVLTAGSGMGGNDSEKCSKIAGIFESKIIIVYCYAYGYSQCRTNTRTVHYQPADFVLSDVLGEQNTIENPDDLMQF